MSGQPSSHASSSVNGSSLLQRLKGSLSSQNQQLIKQSIPSVVQDDPVAPAQPSLVIQPDPVPTPSQAESPDETSQGEELVVKEGIQAKESAVAEATTDQDFDGTLNPLHPVSGGAKEVAPINVTVERPAVDVVPGMQAAEVEKTNELPPEVEGFLKTVEDHHDQIPQEIVISNPQTGQALPRVMAQPVIVLPITPEVEEEGKKKKVHYSVRWLVEWSWKIMKVFSGKVVYRKADST